MKILFDQGVPAPLRKHITSHTVSTVYEIGWSELVNGELIAKAELEFDVFITTDKNLKYQQNLLSMKIAILVLPTTSWKIIESHSMKIARAIELLKPQSFVEIEFGSD
jgi:predicted nuclease of predicted toxin-antitoxin system